MLEAVLQSLLESLLEVAVYGTGHLVLWIVTVGRWGMSNGRDQIAAFVGMIFWGLVGVIIWLAFF